MAAVVVRNCAMTGPDFTPIKAEVVVTKIFISVLCTNTRLEDVVASHRTRGTKADRGNLHPITSPSAFKQDHQPCADMSIQQVRLIQRRR
jgi:hypothetical protein